MLLDRFMVPDDLPLLELSLAKDESHVGTLPEFFYQLGSVTKVYEDEHGPICFVRGAKTLRLDIQYVSNEDHKRNMKAMLLGFGSLAEKARENGFTEIVFQTNNPILKKFCVKRFDFIEMEGEMRKYL